MSFSHLGLSLEINNALNENAYKIASKIQEKEIPLILEKKVTRLSH